MVYMQQALRVYVTYSFEMFYINNENAAKIPANAMLNCNVDALPFLLSVAAAAVVVCAGSASSVSLLLLLLFDELLPVFLYVDDEVASSPDENPEGDPDPDPDPDPESDPDPDPWLPLFPPVEFSTTSPESCRVELELSSSMTCGLREMYVLSEEVVMVVLSESSWVAETVLTRRRVVAMAMGGSRRRILADFW